MIIIDEKLVLLEQTAASSSEIIGRLASLMQSCGYIGEQYLPAVLEREKIYPTGLPSEGVAVAIPHAFCDDVMKTGTAVAVLNAPVEFYNMADSDEKLSVEIVFLMANASDADSHLDDLQELMGCLSSPALLLQLKKARTPQQVAEIMANAQSYAEDDFDF